VPSQLLLARRLLSLPAGAGEHFRSSTVNRKVDANSQFPGFLCEIVWDFVRGGGKTTPPDLFCEIFYR
jgi:hypothetical protein